MEFKISDYHQGQRPNVTLPSPQMLNLLGENGIRQMVGDHYDLLKQSRISYLFPKNEIALEKAKENSADFFIQICGGPDYFNKHRGNPMMARRHAPHPITPEARVTWLECYIMVLQKLNLPDEVCLLFWNYLDLFSMWMVNSKREDIV